MPTYPSSVLKTASAHTVTIVGDLYIYSQEHRQSHLSAFVRHLADLSSMKHEVWRYIAMWLVLGEEFDHFCNPLNPSFDNCGY